MINIEKLVETLPSSCKKVYNTLLFLFDDNFSVENIIEYIKEQKPVIINNSSMPFDRTGLVVSLRDVYYLVLREDLNIKRRRITLLHELSHILLNHVREQDFSLSDIGSRDITFHALYDHIRGDVYSKPYEFEAESLATVLDLKIHQCEALRSLPTIVKKNIKREYQK
jgi:hypothetical protein